MGGTRFARSMQDWFVGRGDLLGFFDQAVEEAKGLRFSFTAIVGEAGLGKSALLDVLADRAADVPIYVCRSCAYETAVLPALQTFSDWVRDLILVGRELRLEQCRRIEADEAVGLALVAPAYCPPATVDRALSLPYREQQSAIIGFCKSYLRAISRAPHDGEDQCTPIAILIDDLHRADDQSLDTLRRFVESNRDSPVVMITAMRPAETHGRNDLDAFLESMVTKRIGQIRRLRPFTRQEVSDYLALNATGRAKWSAARLRAASGGLPLAIRWLLEEGTDSVALFINARVGRLAGEIIETVQALALLAMDFDAELAQALYHHLRGAVGAEESGDGAITRVLVDCGLVIPRADRRYAIIHDLVRREIVGRIDPRSEGRLHAVLGKLLAEGDFLDPETRDLTIGIHLLESPEEIDVRAGLNLLITAARKAERRGSWTDALAIWRRAEKVPNSISDELTRADIEFGVGRAILFKPVAYPEYYEALPKLHHSVEVFLGARAVDRIAEAALINGSINYLGWAEYFRRALEFVPEDHPKRSVIEYRWGSLLVRTLQTEAGERVLRGTLERCRSQGPAWLEAYILPELAEARYNCGDLTEAKDLCKRAAAHPHAGKDPWLIVGPAISHARVLWRLGMSEQAEQIAGKTLDFVADARGMDANTIAVVQAMVARFALARGDWKTATIDVGSETIFNYRPIITAYYLMGRISEGDRYLDGLIPGIRNDQGSWPLVAAYCTTLVGIRCRMCGDGKYVDAARQWAARSIEGLKELGEFSPFMEARIRIGQIRIGFETADEALLLQGSARLDELWPDPSHTQSLHLAEHTLFRAKALAAQGFGKKREAARLFEAALGWCEHYRDLPVRAWTHGDLSFVYHEAEMPKEADRTAERALTMARDLGLKPLEDRLLLGPTAVDRFRSLTGREREVLQLVAEGCANKEIAWKLGISAYTAANHVRHIMEKLGCSNRAEAAALARESGDNPWMAASSAIIRPAETGGEKGL